MKWMKSSGELLFSDEIDEKLRRVAFLDKMNVKLRRVVFFR